jgi:hypothetical protein
MWEEEQANAVRDAVILHRIPNDGLDWGGRSDCFHPSSSRYR